MAHSGQDWGEEACELELHQGGGGAGKCHIAGHLWWHGCFCWICSCEWMLDVCGPQVSVGTSLSLQNCVALEVNNIVSFVECCRAAHITELGDGEQRSAFQCREKVHSACFARQDWKRELGGVCGQNDTFVCQVHCEGIVGATFVFEMGGLDLEEMACGSTVH